MQRLVLAAGGGLTETAVHTMQRLVFEAGNGLPETVSHTMRRLDLVSPVPRQGVCGGGALHILVVLASAGGHVELKTRGLVLVAVDWGLVLTACKLRCLPFLATRYLVVGNGCRSKTRRRKSKTSSRLSTWA